MANSVGTAYLTLVPKMDSAGMKSVSSDFSTAGRQAGQQGGQAAGDGFMSHLKTAINIAAIAAIGKQVFDALSAPLMNFANYEQLVGGVETLFGESSDVIMQYANNAYQTAGLSANQYMETVTSFSASLLQGLDGDTAQAAQIADMAITDMADNANKMGSSMESVQNAYQGFAKQNYTMLDNLKLGYGGTRSEMERLLADAEAITGVHYDINELDDVYQAIHVIQGELGITGTTAEEAASTISGSIASASAAWENFLTGMANGNADMEVLLQELLDSIVTAAQNIIPAVGTIVQNVVDLIAENLPTIIDNVLQWVSANIPTIINAGIDLLTKLAKGIPAAVTAIVTNLPQIIASIVTTLVSPNNISKMMGIARDLWNGFINGCNAMIGSIVSAVKGIVNSLIGAVKNFLGIHSPSRVFRDLGEFTMEGYAEGIDDGAIEAQRAVDRAINSVMTTGVAGSIGVSYGLGAGGGNITIQNLSVNAEDARSADQFVSMLRRAAVAYA